MSRKKYISLCEVVWDFDDVTAKRQRRLKRFFDVDLDNQKLVPCSVDHVLRGNCIDLDQEIENKQTTIGSWGLWRWWKEENRFAKKRYTSEPYADLYPIQVIDCSTEPSEIVDQLKSGVQDYGVEGNVQFLFANVSKGIGILCDSNDFESDDNKFRFKQNVYFLPQIRFKSNSLLSLTANSKKKLVFLNELHPNEDSSILVYPENAIANAVLGKLSQKSKPKDISLLQMALTDVRTESISQEVARLCRCDKNEVIQLIDRFLESCRQPQLLFDGDVKILSRIIECNDELKQKYIAKIEERWRSENIALLEELIAQRNDTVNQLNQTIIKLQDEKKGLEEALEKVREEKKAQDSLVCQAKENLKSIQSKLDESGKELSKLYSDSFNQARQDVGRYLADLAIYAPNFISNPQTTASFLDGNHKSSQRYQFISKKESFNKSSKPYEDEQDAVYALRGSLEEIGFEKNSADLTSGFLWSVYLNQRSLILAGSHAQQIAEATSCALTGRLPDELVCEGVCEQYILDEAFADPDSILLVKNPLDGAWFERLASELAVRRKTVFLSVPFIENLRLIPPSFFDVALPYVANLSIFDASFNESDVKYEYGVPSKDFHLTYDDLKPVDVKDKASRIGIGRNATNMMQRLLACSEAALSNDEENAKKAVFQFGLFSYAYATDSLPTFFELLNENNVVYKRNNPYEDFLKFAK